MKENNKTAMGLVLFVTITLISSIFFKLVDTPDVHYDDSFNDDSFETYSIVLENNQSSINVRPFLSNSNIRVYVEDRYAKKGDILYFKHNGNYNVSSHQVLKEMDYSYNVYHSFNYYNEDIINKVSDLSKYSEFNLNYDENFFREKSIYIARIDGCKYEDILNIYHRNNTIYLMQDSVDLGKICIDAINYNYVFIEIDKNIKINNKEIIYNETNRRALNSGHFDEASVLLNIYKKGNKYMVAFSKINGDKDIMPYLKTLALTLEEAKDVYYNIYRSTEIKVSAEDDINQDEINYVLNELGVIING